ncbi:MAG: site-specific DNA-methyltransferase, partial [Proteobacteria bacterium]|nr:site-specific DNA-methyltransferase [Pseudomonadota bacterium]
VKKPKRDITGYGQKINQLPYIFCDKIKFEKKSDPRKNTYGSKIEAKNKEKIKYLRLRRVIAPNMIELNNDQTVKLIGIAAKAGMETQAMKWLEDKLKGQSFYLKSDKTEYDENNNLLSYLYLKNKTFVNLHLLRTNLVEIDETFDFKYHKKFKAIYEGAS